MKRYQLLEQIELTKRLLETNRQQTIGYSLALKKSWQECVNSSLFAALIGAGVLTSSLKKVPHVNKLKSIFLKGISSAKMIKNLKNSLLSIIK